MKTLRLPLALFCLLLIPAAVLLAAPPAETTKTAEALPKVLILGDSISLGYTPAVVKLLAGKADVRRPKANCQYTDFGLKNLKAWLGEEKWDVIHFNWGIWDTHYVYDSNQAIVPYGVDINAPNIRLRNTPEQYRANLAKLIEQMQATGATLVFANTTPCMEAESIRFANIVKYNETAQGLMDELKIPVTDLYGLSLPNRAQWQGGDKCHFTAAGSQKLAEQVVESITKALAARQAAQ